MSLQERLLTLDEIAGDSRCRVHRVRRCTICVDDPVTDPPVVTEADIDWDAEDRQALAEWDEEEYLREREYDWELASCCGGRDFWCGHYGHGVMSMKDYNAKYGLWDEP
jgi:hypothetical protein